jgi:hypothetical protein
MGIFFGSALERTRGSRARRNARGFNLNPGSTKKSSVPAWVPVEDITHTDIKFLDKFSYEILLNKSNKQHEYLRAWI